MAAARLCLVVALLSAVVVLADPEVNRDATEAVVPERDASELAANKAREALWAEEALGLSPKEEQTTGYFLQDNITNITNSSAPAGAHESHTFKTPGGMDKYIRRARYSSINARVKRKAREARQACENSGNCTAGLNNTMQTFTTYTDKVYNSLHSQMEASGQLDSSGIYHALQEWTDGRRKAVSDREAKREKDKAIAERLGLERRRIYQQVVMDGVSDDTFRSSDSLQLAFKKAVSSTTGSIESDIVIEDIGFRLLVANATTLQMLQGLTGAVVETAAVLAQSPDEVVAEGQQQLDGLVEVTLQADASSMVGFHVNTDVTNSLDMQTNMEAVLTDPQATGLTAAFTSAAADEGQTVSVNMTLASTPTIEFVVTPEEEASANSTAYTPPAATSTGSPQHDHHTGITYLLYGLLAVLAVLLLCGLAIFLLPLLLSLCASSSEEGEEGKVAGEGSPGLLQSLQGEVAELRHEAANNSDSFQMMQATRVPAVQVQPVRSQIKGNIAAAQRLKERCLAREGDQELEREAEGLSYLQKQLQALLDGPDLGPAESPETDAELTGAMASSSHARLAAAVEHATSQVVSGRITEPPSLSQARKVLGDMDRAANHSYFGCKGTRSVEDRLRGRQGLDADANYHRKNTDLIKESNT